MPTLYPTRYNPSMGRRLIGRTPQGNIYAQPLSQPQSPTQDNAAMLNRNPGYVMPYTGYGSVGTQAMLTPVSGGYGYGQQYQAQWTPQQVVSTTTTRDIGELPELPKYRGINEEKLRRRTQEFSALGRREARQSFQSALSHIYGANPDDPYARNLARKASQGFSLDTQRAISEGGRQAFAAALSDQQIRNQRLMQAYQAAVNRVMNRAPVTVEHEYGPVPYQTTPPPTTLRQPVTSQQIAMTRTQQYDPVRPYSLGQPYTYG